MSIQPRAVWDRLSPELQQAIINEFQTILSEVIYEYIRTSDTSPHKPQSDNLHSSVHATPITQQPGESSSTIRFASTSN